MTRFRILGAATAIILTAASASAENCTYAGKSYSPGAQVSTVILECQPNGTWTEKSS